MHDANNPTPRLLGDSPEMCSLRRRLEKVAATPLPVLLIGETGTGKEVAARYLHHLSDRSGPFIAVDCGALSPSLVEAELFGYERGAFTGATQRRHGLVHTARAGTFFLDEVGELPLPAQTRLLRLLEEGTYRPLGAEQEHQADIRVMAATWRDLRESVNEGRFRSDLYHRLAVVELHLPPLRQRPEDIDLLFEHFLDLAAERTGRVPPPLDATVRSHMHRWPWPGNVRELRNVATYLCAMTRGGRVGLADLPPRLLGTPPSVETLVDGRSAASTLVRTDLPYMDARRLWLDDFQVRYVEAMLDEHDGNVSAAARAAGMDRRSIQRILKRARRGDETEDR
ncbi:MAG: sigma-54-dependent Fis family transcriptional regulator [Deltaproteobacteria bacterium]|nr:sigma-54-dependent Fis family transcriptional regulator [Deltaproteobacteria bacterium]